MRAKFLTLFVLMLTICFLIFMYQQGAPSYAALISKETSPQLKYVGNPPPVVGQTTKKDVNSQAQDTVAIGELEKINQMLSSVTDIRSVKIRYLMGVINTTKSPLIIGAAIDAIGTLYGIEQTDNLIAMLNDPKTTDENKRKIISALYRAISIPPQDVQNANLQYADLNVFHQKISSEFKKVLVSGDKVTPEVQEAVLAVYAFTGSVEDKTQIFDSIRDGKFNTSSSSVVQFAVSSATMNRGQTVLLTRLLANDLHLERSSVVAELIRHLSEPVVLGLLASDAKVKLLDYISSNPPVADSKEAVLDYASSIWPDVKKQLEDSIKLEKLPVEKNK